MGDDAAHADDGRAPGHARRRAYEHHVPTEGVSGLRVSLEDFVCGVTVTQAETAAGEPTDKGLCPDL